MKRHLKLMTAIKLVDDSDTDNFVELVKLSGLNPQNDFRFANLENIDFGKCNLSGFDFTGALLTGCLFSSSNLKGAKFDNNQLNSPELSFLSLEMKNRLAANAKNEPNLTIDDGYVDDGYVDAESLPEISFVDAAFEQMSEGVSIFGADGRLKISNAAYARIWRLNEDKLKDNPRFSDIIELCLPLYHEANFWDDLKARTTDPDPAIRHQLEGEIRRSDDKMLTWTTKPLPDGSTLIAWNDVTNARRAEAALIERAEAMEEADRMKSEFVSHVSYQLRTPLTTITGYSDFLQNGGAGEMNDKQSEYVFGIQSASYDLAKIIDDILDIAAIEANVLDLDLGDVNIYEMLNHALDYVATKAEDTQISLKLSCPKDIGMIRADETRLRQVVHNLLSNALRFTKPGGLILVTGAPVSDGGVLISVKDDGVGIPTEKQSQVFDTFEGSRGGAGLGLALVQRFIERHGGWVELESMEGEGTHVTCYLPNEASTQGTHPELFGG